jgi:CRP-like cAMP-binding protein
MAAGKFSRLRAAIVGRGVEIKSALVAGAAANTNIAIAGIRKNGAELLMVIRLEGSGTYAAPVDLIGETAVTSDGNIQTSATATTGDHLLVLYAQPV